MTVPRESVVGEVGRRLGFTRAFVTEVGCVLQTMVLMVRGRIGMPGGEVGRSVRFADGTTSMVYRETTLRTGPGADAVLLVVRFRLRLIGTNRFGHALFRFESLFNTVLFAAHRGFRTKLWLTDTSTGFYRGIYEWEGADRAAAYAEVLRVVLAPWVAAGSFGYRIVEGPDREAFLQGNLGIAAEDFPGGLWWLPVDGSANDR